MSVAGVEILVAEMGVLAADPITEALFLGRMPVVGVSVATTGLRFSSKTTPLNQQKRASKFSLKINSRSIQILLNSSLLMQFSLKR